MSTDITQYGQPRSDDELAEDAQKMHAKLFEQRPNTSDTPMHHQAGPAADADNILHTVKEVRHVTDEKQVNTLLTAGWLLLGMREGVERTGEHEFSPYFRYSMGRVR